MISALLCPCADSCIRNKKTRDKISIINGSIGGIGRIIGGTGYSTGGINYSIGGSRGINGGSPYLQSVEVLLRSHTFPLMAGLPYAIV